MARKDIEVRIKARDQASANAKRAADAMKQLSDTSKSLGTTGAKAANGAAALAREVGALSAKTDNLEKLARATEKLGTAAGAVAKLEDELRDSNRVLEEQNAKTKAAADVAARLKANIDAEAAAQKLRTDRIKQLKNARDADTKAVNDAAAAATKLQNALDGKGGGFNGPRYPTKGVGRNSGAPLSNAQESAKVLFGPEIEAGLGGKSALKAELASLEAAKKTSAASLVELRKEYRKASDELEGFQSDVTKAEGRVSALDEKLVKATTSWSKLDDELGEAGKALGLTAVNQEAVAQATAKAQAELEKQRRTLAAYDSLANKRLVDGTSIADPTETERANARKQAMAQATEQLKLLRDEQLRLDAVLKSGNATEEETASYERMTRAVKLAEEQIRKLQIQERLAQNTTGKTASTGGFGNWAKAYAPIVVATQTATAAQETLNNKTRQSAATAAQIAPQAQRNAQARQQEATATERSAVATERFGRNTRTTLSFMQRMRGEILALTSGFIGFYAAMERGRQAMDAYMAVQKAQNRLSVAFNGDTKQVRQEIGFLNAEADRLGFTFSALADGYGKISIGASSAGFAVADTRELFLSVAEAARVNGSSMDEMNGILRALDQMLSKGCHAPGTLIRMADGSTSTVEAIVVGDKLMGPDGLPREVVWLVNGEQEMFRITPAKGRPFEVNLDHKLQLSDGKCDRTLTVEQYLLAGADLALIHADYGDVPFKIEGIGVGKYFGFEIEGDHLYLDAQGFVHHNSVQAEELRGQLGDRMSGAFKMFADGLGMTTEALGEAMKKGEVYADRETMLKFARRLQQAYGKQVPAAMETLAASLGTFDRDMEKVNVKVAQGFVPAFQELLKAFNKFANSDEGQEVFKRIGEGAGSLLSILAAVIPHMDAVVMGLKAIVAIGLARFAAGAVAGFAAFAQRMTTFTTTAAGATVATQQLAAAQVVATNAIGRASLTMQGWQTQLRAMGSNSIVARAGALGLVGVLGTLRGVMVTVAGVARAMWLAIGGPVGAAAIGVSMIISSWGTNARDASVALSEHETYLQRVRDGYSEVGAGVDDWGKKIRGLTALDAEQNLQRVRDAYMKSLKPVLERVKQIQTMLAVPNLTQSPEAAANRAEMESMRDLITAFTDGTISIEEFKEALSQTASNTTLDAIRDLAFELNAMLEETDEYGTTIAKMNKALKEAEAMVEITTKGSGEAAEATLELNKEAKALKTTLEDKKALKTYNDALTDLKENIPSLAKEMKRLKDITDLNASAWKALVAAWKTGDFSKVREVLSLWTRGATDLGTEDARSVFEGSRGSVGKSAALLRDFEGFIPKAKWDVNAYRVGYGSDTTTDANGRVTAVTKDTTTTEADAERDLARRLIEFQNTVKRQIGEDRFNSFADEQQAVLTSIAYNYGSLPERIIAAVMGGDAGQISQAILGLSGDNNGINARRRTKEAAIFASGENADIGVLVEAEEKRLETAKEQAEATKKRLADLDHEISQQKLLNDGQQKRAAIEDAIREAKAENPNINAAELAAIEAQTAALWDQQNVRHEIEMQEERINNLQTLRQALMDQQSQARAAGDQGQVVALQGEIDGVNARLQEAINLAIQMWTAIGGEEAAAKIESFKAIGGAINASKQQFGAFGLTMQTWQDAFENSVNGVVGAFDAMSQAIANNENAFKAFGNAMLQTLASVMQQIAAAIIKMQILKALQGFGGGIGQMAGVMLGGGMMGHTGGVVGAVAIGGGNRIAQPTWARNALTYHTGGIAGLAPDEVSATLRQGEEILTQQDPRHRDNLGGESAASQGSRLTQILAIGDSEITNAMRGKSGQDVTLTHIKSNAPAIKRMLGI